MAVAAICLGGAAYSLNAEAEPYIGTSVFTLDSDVGDFRGVNITGGIDVNDYVGFRASWMVGAQDETYQNVSVSLERLYGGDLVLTLPVTDSASVYSFVGQTWLEGKASYMGYSATAKGDYTSYGLGLKFAARESIGFFAEAKNIDGDVMLSAGLRFEL